MTQLFNMLVIGAKFLHARGQILEERIEREKQIAIEIAAATPERKPYVERYYRNHPRRLDPLIARRQKREYKAWLNQTCPNHRAISIIVWSTLPVSIALAFGISYLINHFHL